MLKGKSSAVFKHFRQEFLDKNGKADTEIIYQAFLEWQASTFEDFQKDFLKKYPHATVEEVRKQFNITQTINAIEKKLKLAEKSLKKKKRKKDTRSKIILGGKIVMVSRIPPEGKPYDPGKGLLAIDDAELIGLLYKIQCALYGSDEDVLKILAAARKTGHAIIKAVGKNKRQSQSEQEDGEDNEQD